MTVFLFHYNTAFTLDLSNNVCPKISYIKVSDKMAYANHADPDQTAPDQGLLFAIKLSILRNKCIQKKQNLGQKKVWNKVFRILGHLP